MVVRIRSDRLKSAPSEPFSDLPALSSGPPQGTPPLTMEPTQDVWSPSEEPHTQTATEEAEDAAEVVNNSQETDFSDSLDVAQIDEIVRRGQRQREVVSPSESPDTIDEPALEPAMLPLPLPSDPMPVVSMLTEAEDMAPPSLEVTLKLPRTKQLFDGTLEPPRGGNRHQLEVHCLRLMVAIYKILDSTPLSKENKAKLQQVHKTLRNEINSLPPDQLQLFMSRLANYFNVLNKIVSGKPAVADEDTTLLEAAPQQIRQTAQLAAAAAAAEAFSVNLQSPPHSQSHSQSQSQSQSQPQSQSPLPQSQSPATQSSPTQSSYHSAFTSPGQPISLHRAALQEEEDIPLALPASVPQVVSATVAPKKVVPKKVAPSKAAKASPTPAKKRKYGRRKPLLPYKRYHFALPAVPEFTTFNGFNDDEDDDIVEQSMTISLLDPVSGSRYVTPLRSRFCSHVECFDMSAFLAMHHLRPFKVGIRTERPLANGKPNVSAILRDTKRHPLDPHDHNKQTLDFQYRKQYTQNKRNGRYNNKLHYFQCPICKLEFNIDVPGDVYVVGDLVDLLFALEKSDDMNVEKVEIDDDGNWRPIREDDESQQQQQNKKKTEDVEVIDLDDESDDDDSGKVDKIGPKVEPVEASLAEEDHDQGPEKEESEPDRDGTEVLSSDFEDSWDEEFREIDEMLDKPSRRASKSEHSAIIPPDPQPAQPAQPAQQAHQAHQAQQAQQAQPIQASRPSWPPQPTQPTQRSFVPFMPTIVHAAPAHGSQQSATMPLFQRPAQWPPTREGNNGSTTSTGLTFENIRPYALLQEKYLNENPPQAESPGVRQKRPHERRRQQQQQQQQQLPQQQPQPDESSEPVFFTGNGNEEDPFVID